MASKRKKKRKRSKRVRVVLETNFSLGPKDNPVAFCTLQKHVELPTVPVPDDEIWLDEEEASGGYGVARRHIYPGKIVLEVGVDSAKDSDCYFDKPQEYADLIDAYVREGWYVDSRWAGEAPVPQASGACCV